jgi:hypothetical protein
MTAESAAATSIAIARPAIWCDVFGILTQVLGEMAMDDLDEHLLARLRERPSPNWPGRWASRAPPSRADWRSWNATA